MRALLASLLLLASGLVSCPDLPASQRPSPFDTGPAKVEFLPVEEAYQVELEVLDDNSLRVYWVIADSYYLYQHRFNFSLTNAQGDVPLAVELPDGLHREDEYFGEVEVYYNYVDILLQPERATGDSHPGPGLPGLRRCRPVLPAPEPVFQLDFTSGSSVPLHAPASAAQAKPN